MTTGTEVVAAARAWIGTPFEHLRRIRGRACDCAGLVIGVARELVLVPADFDVKGYPRQPDGRTLIALCGRFMRRLRPDEMRPGDVAAISFGSVEQHLGILGDYRFGGLSLIHASNVCRPQRVIEHRLMLHGGGMVISAAYRLPGVA